MVRNLTFLRKSKIYVFSAAILITFITVPFLVSENLPGDQTNPNTNLDISAISCLMLTQQARSGIMGVSPSLKDTMVTKDTSKTVNKEIDAVFETAVKECYTDCTEISSPILSRDKINELIRMYKDKLPQPLLKRLRTSALLCFFAVNERVPINVPAYLR